MPDPFDEFIREIRKLDGTHEFSVPIETDEKGYYDKECPAQACQFVFKVNQDDWRNLFKDEAVYCPRCGHTAPSDHWWTTEQLEHAKEEAFQQFKGRVNQALHRGARGFNRHARGNPLGGFIQMSASVSGTGSVPLKIPARARGVLEQELQCDECAARYSVLGTAFFCPCCGHNSAERLFEGTLQKIRERIDGLELIRKTLTEAGHADQAEDTSRTIVESALQDSVMAFQHYVEALYTRTPNTSPPHRNAFQRLAQGSDLWEAAVGVTYESIIGPTALAELTVLFQQRHLLAHRQGIVDQEYIDKSGDQTYRVGQRVVVTPSSTRKLVDWVDQLAAHLRGAT